MYLRRQRVDPELDFSPAVRASFADSDVLRTTPDAVCDRGLDLEGVGCDSEERRGDVGDEEPGLGGRGVLHAEE